MFRSLRFMTMFAWLGGVASLSAHPGVGIVQDSRGNVYFTDLRQVWKIAPDGTKSVAVPNVHTHELCLDGDDNLYGEHLWYEGDATKKWGHRVWRRARDGTLTDIVPAREGFLNDQSFVRDRAGAMYWADPGPPIVIKKRSADGAVRDYSTGDFRDVQWMTARPDGTLYLMDKGDLRRIGPDGKLSTVVARLSSQNPAPAQVVNRHYHMGLWTSADGQVYVAVHAERAVVRVGSDGKVSVAARSPAPWSPTGGMIDRDGNLWLLEGKGANDVRVRRIDRDGNERLF